jgi:hypothetical protein
VRGDCPNRNVKRNGLACGEPLGRKRNRLSIRGRPICDLEFIGVWILSDDSSGLL